MLITSSENEKIKNWKKLREKKYRDQTGTFLVEGTHLVLEAFKKNFLLELILEQDEILPLDIKTTYVTKEIIKDLTTLETPVNVLGICKKMPEYPDLGDRILMIDGIQDPGNLGTVIRSALAFNVDTVVLGSNTVDLYNPKVIRATQGMIFHINIIEKDLLLLIPELQNEQYRIIGTKVTHGIKLQDYKDYTKYALIVGNEGQGVSDEVKELCDDFIYIEMNDHCESLNVGVATSVILYELNK